MEVGILNLLMNFLWIIKTELAILQKRNFKMDSFTLQAVEKCSVTLEEIPSLIENELSKSPYIASSDSIDSDTNFYTDKNVLECNTPELTVCYKDINYHAVKDICVDEGMPVNDKILIGSREDDDSHWEGKEGVSGDELKRPKLPSESSSDKDLMQKVETNSGGTDGTVIDGSAEDSFVDRSLPIQGFGTRSFLRSFISSLDGEGFKVPQLSDQKVSSGKPVSAGPDTSSAEAGPNNDVQARMVERKSITFKFNSPAPETAGVTNGKTENINEQSIDSMNVLGHKNTGSYNPSDSTQVHCNSIKNTSIEKVHEESLKVDSGFSNDFSTSNQAQCVSSKDVMNKNIHDQLLALPDHKDENNSHNFDSHVLKINNESVVIQEKYEQGESSFSSAGFIAHSGPIAFSGSISFRSDGSATSGRSFAFPILQSEWNSSPVRMTKADRRHFRKHKCWRTGLFCCRF